MKKHQPLEWISKNFCFPDSAGRELARKPVGPYLLDFQKKIIKEIFDHEGNIKSSIFIYGCRKVSKTMLGSMAIWYLVNDSKRRGVRLPVMASVLYQSKLFWQQLVCQKYKKDDVRFFMESIKQKKTKAQVDFFCECPWFCPWPRKRWPFC